ncbi:MAG: hypothetical protein HYZ88_03120 [Candidatus Omnitrophica bacterium]|nr:hypothetical protein [Candidatus Omnitrophota bacterium]
MNILVQFQEGLLSDRRRRLVESLGAVLKEEITPQRAAVVELPEGADLREWLERFRCSEGIVHVEPDAEVQPLGGGS